MNKETFKKISAIAERAAKMKLLSHSKFTLMADLEHADKEFDLRLDDLQNADDLNFSHDIVGIQRNINRETGEIGNSFIPRFAAY